MLEKLANLNLDIRTTIVVVVVGLVFISFFVVLHGARILRYADDVTYIQKKRKITRQGWRIIFMSVAIFLSAIVCGMFGEDMVYQVYVPSSTITLTSSITPSLTITLTPTITLSPTLTRTPSITPTPFVPDEITALFEGVLEPGSNIIFSSIRFSDAIDEYYQPILEKTSFDDSVEIVYGSFTYNNMQPGLQWTALWVNPIGEVICYETEVWGNFTGGYGYTECTYDPETWMEGEYQVQMFLGNEWWQTNTFTFGETPVPAEDTE
jgi:hypothetical protein